LFVHLYNVLKEEDVECTESLFYALFVHLCNVLKEEEEEEECTESLDANKKSAKQQ
jgi:hypothetical protein